MKKKKSKSLKYQPSDNPYNAAISREKNVIARSYQLNILLNAYRCAVIIERNESGEKHSQ